MESIFKEGLNLFRFPSLEMRKDIGVEQSHVINKDNAATIIHSLWEYDLIYEILHNLIGFRSDGDNSFKDSLLKSAGGQVSLEELFEKVNMTCDSYRTIKGFLEKRLSVENNCGLVVQSLGSAISCVMKEYHKLVLGMEIQFRQDQLTLQRIWYFIQTPCDTLLSISNFIIRIERDSMIGCQVINCLYEERSAYPIGSTTYEVYNLIINGSLLPIMEFTYMFMKDSHIYDPYGDYFIESSNNIKKDSLEYDYNASYWIEKFLLKERFIPKDFMIAGLPHKILLIGKNVNILKESCCLDMIDMEELSKKAFLATRVDSSYIEIIESYYLRSNSAVMDLLVGKHDIFGILYMVKSVYFMDNGDIFDDFLDSNRNDLETPVSKILLEHIQEDFDRCLKIHHGDRYKDMYLLGFSNQSLQDHMAKIIYLKVRSCTIDTEQELSGINALIINCHVKFPLTLLLSMRSMIKYQMVFRFLFQCYQIYKNLISIPLRNNNIYFNRDPVIARFIIFKYKLVSFMNFLNSYLKQEVLHSLWVEFQRDAQTSNYLDEIILLHNRFLDSCLKETFLTNWKLFRILNKLVNNCNLLFGLCNIMDHVFKKYKNGKIESKVMNSLTKKQEKLEINFNFHLKLLIHNLKFSEAADCNHKVASFISQVENIFCLS